MHRRWTACLQRCHVDKGFFLAPPPSAACRLERRITLKDLLDLRNRDAGFQVDSFGVRHVFYGAPATAQRLSSLLVAPTVCVHRYAVATSAGERCVLTFALALVDTLTPQ